MQKIAVIGTGYVGLVSGACMADFGMRVTCVDKDETKVNKLKAGILPIYEPGLEELVARTVRYGNLCFTTDIKSAVEENEIIFIAVGTPPKADGSVDLSFVEKAAEQIGESMNGYKVIVNKSTVAIGTGQKVKRIINKVLEKRGLIYEFDIVSNPEFLREGEAIHDFTHPDRIIIGAESEKAVKAMNEVYRVLYLYKIPCLLTNIETAELIKYASNAFLATKISFINELTELCEKAGADIKHVSKGMGMDKRIGSAFLNAGPGYGGSCFPKDTSALLDIAQNYDCSLSIVSAAIEANDSQKKRMVRKISNIMGALENKEIAVLGLTFKPDTDDIRESPALSIIRGLAEKGATLRVYDPLGVESSKKELKTLRRIQFCKDEYEAIKDSHALVIVTEWNQFRDLDFSIIKETMKDYYFFDLRNIYNSELVKEAGFIYTGIG